MTDKKIANLASVTVLAVLLFALLIPHGESGRIVAAILLLPGAVGISLLLKKRNILSLHKNQVFLLMTVVALVYVMGYYLSGLHFGFYRNPYRFSGTVFLRFLLPTACAIVSIEAIRCVLVAQTGKAVRAVCYLSCVVTDLLLCSTLPAVTSFSLFMKITAGTLFPAVLSNLLYHYLAGRYGLYPNLIFRLIMTLHGYLFPVVPGMPEAVQYFVLLLLPIAVYLFIDGLYEKKKRYALGRPSRARRVISWSLTVLTTVIMLVTVMLVSNRFQYGAFVIATESMTGALEKGDVAVYERYEDQLIEEGQVIVFEKSDFAILHRVVDIEIINGNTRYYTKGDANEDMDAGYVTDAEIIGLVDYKVPFLGFPTLWLRSFFEH